jgi:3-hydroxyacyl-CoA dehydrogenase
VPRSTLPVYRKQVFRAPLAGEDVDATRYGHTVFETEAVRAWVDDRTGENDVLIVSFRSKMNTLGSGVLDGLMQAIEVAEREYAGVVVWQPTSLTLGTPGGAFSAGANLEEAMPAFISGGAQGIEPVVAKFQQTMLRVKYAAVPVVSAVSGIALGGGCELLLHSAKRVAHLESYIGLVESGVGLLPAGGGLKEAAIRAAQSASATAAGASGAGSNLLQFLQKPFENAARALVSGSALDAREMGYLKPSDIIVLNVHELLHVAKNEALRLATSGYRPPLPAARIPVAGRSAISTIKASLVNMRDGRFISDHDFLIASRIAEVVCGGEVEAGSLVDEAWLLALERRAFVELLGTPKTQERIMGMLQTGKPVRN